VRTTTRVHNLAITSCLSPFRLVPLGLLYLGSFATALAGSGGAVLLDAAGSPLGGGAGFTQNLEALVGDFNDDGFVSAADMVGVNNATVAAYIRTDLGSAHFFLERCICDYGLPGPGLRRLEMDNGVYQPLSTPWFGKLSRITHSLLSVGEGLGPVEIPAPTALTWRSALFLRSLTPSG
jgi:hypothetical protein